MTKKAPVQHQAVYRADYKPPAFLVDQVELDIDVRDKNTRVTSRLEFRRNPESKERKAPLVLDGEAQKLIAIKVNGIKLSAQNYTLTETALTVPYIPDEAVIEIESTNEPAKNTSLFGLYKAGPMLCTQCESQGFRRITYFPDRPDVQSTFRVTIHADKAKYPYLLANGNLVKKGKEKGGRHFAVWEDPHRKPCYLFAMVAGKLDRVSDHFVTKSGRKVLIEIYTEPGKAKETGLAMQAVHKAMRWDEQRYGLEYDLDRFMLVAVSFFNFGAMENKGLNIFNDACVLGRPETATDLDIAFFERVVGHEYFHNWTGDRVTCRDWFQLTLKEGLTVFREQHFVGDMNSRAMERIRSVSMLRRAQFPEDAGPMAHPLRPESYISEENLVDSTTYNKGSEVIRMIQTLVGDKGFRKGMDLYFKRHDGHSATCDDFVRAMADANKIDLSQFMLWYSQAGTPVLDVTSHYDAKKKEYTLRVKQSCPPTPGQKTKKPFYMPFAVGLLDEKGKDMKGTFIVDLSLAEETITFLNVESKPIPSLLRDFSAPVRLNYDYTDEELRLIMAGDIDGFNRWDAGQKLFTKYVLSGGKVPSAFLASLRKVLRDKKLDAATKAATLTLPSEAELGLALVAAGKKIDPIFIYESRQAVIRAMADELADDLWAVYEQLDVTLSEKACDGEGRGQRALKNLCLAYLNKVEPETVAPLAFELVARSSNLTDKIAGLDCLMDSGVKTAEKALDLFAKKFKDYPTIMDEWLSVQAGTRRADVLTRVRKLTKSKVFDFKNPNRVSALLAVFAMNPLGMHAADGSGYKFMTEMALKVDALNGTAASRLVKPLLRWRDYDAKRQKLMKAELLKLAAVKKLSPNTHEIVSKALGKH